VVEVDGQIVGRGRGPTKKASQQEAAEQALSHLKGGDDIDERFIVKIADESSEDNNKDGESSEGDTASDGESK
jgi:hypothetical protein